MFGNSVFLTYGSNGNEGVFAEVDSLSDEGISVLLTLLEQNHGSEDAEKPVFGIQKKEELSFTERVEWEAKLSATEQWLCTLRMCDGDWGALFPSSGPSETDKRLVRVSEDLDRYVDILKGEEAAAKKHATGSAPEDTPKKASSESTGALSRLHPGHEYCTFAEAAREFEISQSAISKATRRPDNHINHLPSLPKQEGTSNRYVKREDARRWAENFHAKKDQRQRDALIRGK